MLATLRSFAAQGRTAFDDARRVVFPRRFRQADQIVICGMGGSTLGSDVIRSVFSSQLRVPLTIVNDYTLPHAVDRRSFVILSSYSGTTEEVLSVAAEAKQRGAMVTGLAKGGPLGAWLKRYRLPWYKIDGVYNPAGQPRMGLGYSVFGQLGLLAAVGALLLSKQTVTSVCDLIDRWTKRYDMAVTAKRNPSKQLASALVGRWPILVGAEHLVGSVHAFANQLNETAKTMAVPFALPELNHHLLEGLRFPAAARTSTFVFFDSPLLQPRIRQRIRITSQIVARQGLKTQVVRLTGRGRLEDAVELLTISGWTSFYLSVLHRVDPLSILTVDELKRRLRRA